MTMDQTPLYKYPAVYARENDELEPYRASHKANIACKEAIERAIRENYRDNCLGNEAVKQVVDEFGFDRTLYVLANTVQRMDWDGRFSEDNKRWARTVVVHDDMDAWRQNRNADFVVSASNPGLTDLFLKQARQEYLWTLPLTKEDITSEGNRILRQLQNQCGPNSPEETQFMAQISPDFLIRASTKDQDKLFGMLPFSSLTFSTLKDRAGVYAFIDKDENRNQPLRQRKPSVRGKLQETRDTPKPHAKPKDRGAER